MTAALCCPGPSLEHAPPSDIAACDIRVGVNRAATKVRCDYWASFDYPTIRDVQAEVLGSPGLFTRRQTWLDARKFLRLVQIRLVDDLMCPVPKWDLRTAPASLVFIASLGAKRIDVYGADMQGDADWDGRRAGEDRTDKRWSDERETWDAIVAWLAGRGCEVRRV